MVLVARVTEVVCTACELTMTGTVAVDGARVSIPVVLVTRVTEVVSTLGLPVVDDEGDAVVCELAGKVAGNENISVSMPVVLVTGVTGTVSVELAVPGVDDAGNSGTVVSITCELAANDAVEIFDWYDDVVKLDRLVVGISPLPSSVHSSRFSGHVKLVLFDSPLPSAAQNTDSSRTLVSIFLNFRPMEALPYRAKSTWVVFAFLLIAVRTTGDEFSN